MNYEKLPPGFRVLPPSEVVCAGDLVLWSTSPRDAWTDIVPKSPFCGMPVETLRVRHGQPELSFATKRAKYSREGAK
jgi:hypothetical protein